MANKTSQPAEPERHDLAKLASLPLAEKLIEALMYEALQPLYSVNPTELALITGRRNLAVELLTTMEIIK